MLAWLDLAWTVATVAAAGVNLHAVVALVLGARRAATADDLGRLARRCALSASALATLGMALVAVALLAVVHAGAAEPSEKAARLGRAISEGINGGTFVVIACTLPFAAARRLDRKARRLGGDFTEG